jgi:hypothetical protein
MAAGSITAPTILPARVANVDSNSAADQNTQSSAENQNYLNAKAMIGGTDNYNDTINSIDNRVSQLEKSVHSITADYTILDNDGYGTINVDPSARAITVTLPTAAANPNREILVKVTDAGGTVEIDGEGAETIDGELTINLQSQYDYALVYCDGVEWFIKSMKMAYRTGWINTSDWTNRHLGSVNVNYNNLVGSFILGEVVTDGTTGATGIIQSDNGSLLVLKDVTGGGTFGNTNQITGGTSGATADVNGDSKNTDTSIFHEFNKNLRNLNIRLFGSSDGTEGNTKLIQGTDSDSGGRYNISHHQSDVDNIVPQTGSSGIIVWDGAGAVEIWNTNDYYYNIIVEVIK